MNLHVYVYIYIYMHIYLYIYMYQGGNQECCKPSRAMIQIVCLIIPCGYNEKLFLIRLQNIGPQLQGTILRML